MSTPPRYWCIVPAAGIGRRMRSDIPKQYLPLAGETVLVHTLRRLSAITVINSIHLAMAEDDPYSESICLDVRAQVIRTPGGVERCHSVFNAMQQIALEAAPEDWVLVHDAARPCVRKTDIEHLIGTLSSHRVGGLLGIPVRDTMKRSTPEGKVVQTVERNGLWHALTPQMFRFGMLHQALQSALESGRVTTDESSAIELLGEQPLLVEGHADNIKITRPEDLALAEFYLDRQELEAVVTSEFDDGF